MSATAEQYIPGRERIGAIQRIPPHDVDAECGVLGSMMMGGAAVIHEMESLLNGEMFYVPAHQTVWWALCSLNRAGSPVDLITLTAQLRDYDENKLASVGGPSALTALFTFVPTAANVNYYAEILREKYTLRQLIATGTEIVRRAYEPLDDGVPGSSPIQELVDLAQQRFTELALSMSKRGALMRPTSETIPEAHAEVLEIHRNRGGTRGLETGFFALDRMTNGLKPGQVITIAARTSVGKSSWAMNIAENVAANGQEVKFPDGTKKQVYTPVAIFSLEMSTEELNQRLLLSRSRIALQRLRDGHLKDADLPRLERTANELSAAPIYIDDTPGLRLFEFMARARKARVSMKVGLIIIDYVQLMASGTKRGMENRVLELTEITGGIKKIARELGIPVIMLAQLNREADKRPGGIPRLADLRESGSFEQDSDIVAFIHRPEMHEANEEKRAELEGQATVIIAKHRNGPRGPFPLTFLAELTRFENPAGEMRQSNNPEHRQGNLNGKEI